MTTEGFLCGLAGAAIFLCIFLAITTVAQATIANDCKKLNAVTLNGVAYTCRVKGLPE